jgi:mannitol/fructose-specific phosphotransferase system IIA component (Ntr-type)
MNLMESLRPECIRADSHAAGKQEVLAEIAALAKQSPLLDAVPLETIRTALEEREKIGSTGFGQGIAIPHCGLEELDDFVVGLLLVPRGLDFNALDGQPTKAFFFIVGPKQRRNQHIQILSALSKLLKTPRVVEDFLALGGAEAVRLRFLQLVQVRDTRGEPGQCLFHVFVQREECFDDILQEISSVVQGALSVVETNNAGYYLHRLPLFSAYWSETRKGFFRIVLALVDKDRCNDLIRRLHMIAEPQEGGVLITVQELMYAGGSLEF